MQLIDSVPQTSYFSARIIYILISSGLRLLFILVDFFLWIFFSLGLVFLFGSMNLCEDMDNTFYLILYVLFARYVEKMMKTNKRLYA